MPSLGALAQGLQAGFETSGWTFSRAASFQRLPAPYTSRSALPGASLWLADTSSIIGSKQPLPFQIVFVR